MENVPWGAILIVGGAALATTVVAILTGWAPNFIEDVLP